MTIHRANGHRLGLVGYLDVLQLLTVEPCTAKRLGERMNVRLQSAQAFVRRLHAMRLVHMGSWEPRSGHGFQAVVMWHAGRGADVPAPDGKARFKAERKNELISCLIALSAFLDALREPISVRRLVEVTGMDEMTVGRLLHRARHHGMARIADWHIMERPATRVPLWQLGKGPQAPRPPAQCGAKLQRHYVARDRRLAVGLDLHHAFVGMAQVGGAA